MIEIKPNDHYKLTCPECKSDKIKVNSLVFSGIRVLADCVCENCQIKFFNDMPVGHALYFPFKIEKERKNIYGQRNYKWFTDALSYSFSPSAQLKVKIEKKILQEGFKEVIILNCLDYLYGHVLLKLFNTTFYLDKYPDKGLILILPKSFEWLVPKGVSEVWLVNVKLSQAKNWLVGLDEFVQKELLRFSKVFLSPAYSHPYLKDVDISRYSGVPAFNLKDFSIDKPVVTFIYREDRLWHINNFEYLIFLALRKFKVLPYFKWLFPAIQIRRITSLFDKIKKILPEAEFYVTGLGTYGKFPNYVKDERKVSVNDEAERKWCELYSKSNVVIGIHGSNMLLPSAHAAGFVEILPKDRISNITQDLFCKYDSRDMLFLGRFVDGYSTPKDVSHQTVTMIKGWKVFNLYTAKENLVYKEITPSDFEVKRN